MVTMGPREQLPFNLFILIAILFLSCNSEIHDTYYNADSVNIVSKGGVTYIDSFPANGIVYSLNARDTLSVDHFINGKKQGLSRIWYPNRQLKEIRFFDKGRYEGEHKGWWENGRQKFIYHYRNDVFDGNVKEWQSDGLLFRDFNFENGYEHGMQRMWYSNGKIKANYCATGTRQYGLTGTKHCINVFEKRN
jgi:antitoxin component YwqK of YwqJK toxin-antitoxin module